MDVDDPDVQDAELEWVSLIERGAAHFNDGHIAAAGDDWQRACDIASGFDPGDARYAASLGNLGVLARYDQRPADAERLLRVLQHPFDEHAADSALAEPAPAEQTENYRTFCGT